MDSNIDNKSSVGLGFVAVKTAEQQAQGMLFRTRDLLVRQRTQTINALRGHLAEFGVVAPQGPAHVTRLAQALEDPTVALPDRVRTLGTLLFDRIVALDAEIAGLAKELRDCARHDDEAARLMTNTGVGPITAMALKAFAPPMESFRRGRDFAAWLGLVPRQHTTGGKPRLGKISKMGQRDLRRLLITGAMAVVHHAVRRGETKDPWLAGMLARSIWSLQDGVEQLSTPGLPWRVVTHAKGDCHVRFGRCSFTIAEERCGPMRELCEEYDRFIGTFRAVKDHHTAAVALPGNHGWI